MPSSAEASSAFTSAKPIGFDTGLSADMLMQKPNIKSTQAKIVSSFLFICY